MIMYKLYTVVFSPGCTLARAHTHTGHYLDSAKAVRMLYMLNITVYHLPEYQHMPQSEE